MCAHPLPYGTTHSTKLRGLFAGILVMGILIKPCRAQESSAQIMQDAKTAGATSATAIQSAIANTNTANAPLPDMSSSNLMQQGKNQVVACQATTSSGTSNPQCDAINTAQSDAGLRTSLGQPVTASDPSVQAAQTVIQQPNSVIGTFDTATSPCSTAALTTPSGQPTAEITSDCSNQTFSDGQGNSWNIGHPPDTSFKSVVTGSEALREAGLTLNAANMTVLAGEDDRCRIAQFGVDNCCHAGGTSAFTALTDRALSAVTAAQNGMDPIRDFSNYTYNALFPGMANLITDLTIPPSLWSSLQLSLQLSGLINCTDEEKNLALKRDANLCTDIGEYCSETTPIIHLCIQHTHTYCCFNSQLAQAINVQGKAQLGISMGTPENPNCGGLTISQFQGINISTMHLSAFQNEISPYGVDASQATTQAINAGAQSSGTSAAGAAAKSISAKARSTNKAANSDPASEPPCFYGVGKCGP
jgi:hypothetical protein